MAQLTKEQQAAIDNYSNDIQTLKDTVTAIRKLPGNFCAGRGNKGFLSLIREIYQNAIDQVMDPNSPADAVWITYNEQTLETIVEEHGLGFPHSDMVRMITEQYTSKNYEKKPFCYSSGMHGVGLKVTNALSTECSVLSYKYDGTAMQLDLKEGYVVGKGPYKIPNKEKKQGSIVKFTPSVEVLGNIDLSWKEVYTLVKDIASLVPIGTKVFFVGIDKHGKAFKENIVNTDGIITKLINTVKRPICKPIVIGYDSGYYKLDVAFCYDMGESETDGVDSQEKITSFCNMCPTIAGEHITGTIDGICFWFSKYMNNVYLAGQANNSKKKNKLVVTYADIKSGLNAMISGFCLEPLFVGQAKEQLSVPEMKDFCKNTVINGLEEWSKTNPQDLAKLAKFFKEMAEIRTKSDKEKVKIANKFGSNPLNGLPAKYKRPLGRQNIELILVEGDSALGTVVDGRDPMCQGALPLRGKVPNAFSNTRQKFFENEEVQSIIRIILGSKGYDRHFKAPDDCLVNRIIIMCDADVDGSHIAALLLRMFIMYMPQIIEAGMLYKAIPPLYSITQGKKKKYFTENIDITKFIQKAFTDNYTLSTSKKTTLTGRELTMFFIKNADYIFYLNDLADTYKVHRSMAEFAMYHYVLNGDKFVFDKFKKEATKLFRFCDIKKVNGTIIFTASIDEKYTMFINDKTVYDARYLLDILHNNNQLYYLVNGNKSTLYDIMNLYDKVTPNGVQRYKGLGEMDDDELAESTLLPTGNRTLIRYTLSSARDEIETIRQFESDPKKILTLVGNVTREDLLD